MAWARKLPSGRWQACYRDSTGATRTAGTFSRKSDARDVAEEEERKLRRGEWIDPDHLRMPFREYAGRYMTVTLNQDTPTRVRDDSLLRNHLLPAFGDTGLGTIATGEVRAWIADLSGRLAPSTVALCYQLFARILRSAEEDGYILKTPCTPGVKLPRLTRSKRADRWLTIDGLEHLAGTIEPRFRATVFTMGYMGLRFGEMAGLRRDKLDLLRGTLEVAGQLREVRGRQEYVAFAKTAAGLRKLPLPASLVAELQSHLEEHTTHPEYVFAGRDGRAAQEDVGAAALHAGGCRSGPPPAHCPPPAPHLRVAAHRPRRPREGRPGMAWALVVPGDDGRLLSPVPGTPDAACGTTRRGSNRVACCKSCCTYAARRGVTEHTFARSDTRICPLTCTFVGGRYWDRTSDLFGVNEALSR